MKSNRMHSLVQLNNESLQQLVAEVKETIAIDVVKSEKTSLKLVDIWKIEKSRKYATKTFAQKRNIIPFI